MEQNKVKFYLFTNNNADNKYEILINDRKCLLNSYFEPAQPTRILIHGFRDNEHAALNVHCKRSYLGKGQYNVIVVDWSCYAHVNPLRYRAAVERIPTVGKLIAKFLQFLLYCYDEFSLSRVYLIGFSLGAHVAGYAGKCLEGQIPTIFGLDPAKLWSGCKTLELSQADAQYVEVLHTGSKWQSIGHPMGDADFYANYGDVQPNASGLFGLASHLRAIYLFAESISSETKFWATQTNYSAIKGHQPITGLQVVKMGDDPSNQNDIPAGIYYFETNSKSPYAKGLE